MGKGKLTQNGVHLQDHEYVTVKFFLEQGIDVELIPKSQIKDFRQPDIMMNGTAWEIKAPIGAGKKTIQNILQNAAGQSRNVIVDLFRSKMDEDKAIIGYRNYFMESHRIKRLKIIKKNREILDFQK
ncbi:MAG: hypothetical protein IJI65_02515 [Lachnospiraceae bacterium]|nr:hypothetical protein [Lachnospiraceae bacterium]